MYGTDRVQLFAPGGQKPYYLLVVESANDVEQFKARGIPNVVSAEVITGTAEAGQIVSQMSMSGQIFVAVRRDRDHEFAVATKIFELMGGYHPVMWIGRPDDDKWFDNICATPLGLPAGFYMDRLRTTLM